MRWRLLIDEPADGARNMAVDEVLFLSSSRAEAMPTVRLYQFRSPTITLGHALAARDAIDPEACAAKAIDCVRRITGGGALLHQHELTWSVASPATGVFSGLSVRGVYAAINEVLRGACTRLGVPLDPPPAYGASNGRPRTPPSLACLSTPTVHEITSSGKKLVPSAMRRNRRSFLQHGALLFAVDMKLWADVKSSQAPKALEAIGVWDLVATPPPASAVHEAFRSSFAKRFGRRECADSLSAWERSQLPRLEEKYADRAFRDGDSNLLTTQKPFGKPYLATYRRSRIPPHSRNR